MTSLHRRTKEFQMSQESKKDPSLKKKVNIGFVLAVMMKLYKPRDIRET